MQLRTLARTGIAGCAAGAIIILAAGVHLADAFRSHQSGMANLDRLQFAVARLGINVNHVVADPGEAPDALDSASRQLEIIDESLRTIRWRAGDAGAGQQARDKVAELRRLARQIERGLAADRSRTELDPLLTALREGEADLTLAESELLGIQYHRLDRQLMIAVVIFALTGFGLILACLVLFVLFSRRIHAPLRHILEAIDRAGRGDLDQRLAVDADDELGALARTFNEMLEQRHQHERDLGEKSFLLEVAGRLAHFGGWSVDLRRQQVTWSDEVAAIHDLPAGSAPTVDEAIGYYAPEWRERIRDIFTTCARDGVPYDEEMELVTARGRRIWVRTIGEAVHDADGTITHVRGAFQEISGRKKVEQNLRERTEALRERVKELRCINTVTALLDDRDRTFEQVMPEVVRTIPMGWRYSEIAEARIEAEGEVFHTPEFRRTPWLMHEQVRVDGATAGSIEVVYLEERAERDEGPFLGEERDLLRMIASKFGSVLEQRLTRERLRRMAFEDELTGLLSRTGFEQRLEAAVAGLEGDASACLVILDLHHLNDVNQVYGYETGDRLLAAVAGRLRSQLGPSDLVGRLGGDQFALLLHGLPPGCGDATDLAHWVHEAFSTPFLTDGHEIPLEITLGVACREQQEANAAELMRRALLAFHGAREDRLTDTMVYSSELDLAARDRLRLVEELRTALTEGQFELYYQPRVRLEDGRITGAEGLLRWRHPGRGLLSPDVFIPIAEHSRLIMPMGEVVIREACTRLRAWEDDGLPAIPLAINVSMVQILDSGFVDVVERILRDFDTDPAGLVIEITESVLAHEPEFVRGQIARLHEMGLRLSLDDFGTGYSSLGQLNRYSFDEIKIDRSFVRHAVENSYSREIVRMIIGLSQVMGSEVVAEGVETLTDRNLLLELGCTLGQGFLYTKPLPEHEFVALLKSGSITPQPAF